MKFLKKQHKSWTPPFCPNRNCTHHKPLQGEWRYKKSGFYKRSLSPNRIQRFTCLHCKQTFSTQTFSTTYWQKLPLLDSQILTKTIGCMSNRQLATDLKVAPETINRHLARIARQLMLRHYLLLKDVPPPSDLVIDGFESFEYSQYHPIHHHLAIEKGTDFVIYFTDSELRRKGRMTALQKERRAELEAKNGRPDKKAISKDVGELLRVTLRGQSEATVYSDDHKSYLKPIREVDCKIIHRITPGKEHRSVDNELWEVNLADLQIRHCSANHKRETIAWSKRRQCSSERLVIFIFWKNYMRSRRVKDPRGPSPAMARGMLDRKLKVEDVFSERIFFDHVELPERWQMYYWRTVSTRALDRERHHDLKYAV